MNITEALEELDRLAAQIIHPKDNVFRRMAEAIRAEMRELKPPARSNNSLRRYLRSLAADMEDTGEKAAMLNAADEIDRLENQIAELHTIITGDWESKEAFIARVRATLFPETQNPDKKP